MSHGLAVSEDLVITCGLRVDQSKKRHIIALVPDMQYVEETETGLKRKVFKIGR